MTRSSTRPRFLFHISFNNKSQVLESCSQEVPYSDHQKVNITQRQTLRSCFSQPVRGLICYRNETKVMVGNPSTGQFLTLPKVKTRKRCLFSFFGYDPVNHVYKVLCITVRESRVGSNEHQVFTLGPKQKWRKITCKHPQYRPSNIIHYINGVVYYYAWIKDEGSLICFDFTFEDFNVVKLPRGIPFIANYDEKLALVMSNLNDETLKLWVLQDVKKQEWLKVSHVVPSLTGLSFMFKGTLSTGQLIFAPLCYHPIYTYFLISYDPRENNVKTIVIEGIGERLFTQLFIDHVESPMVLSKF